MRPHKCKCGCYNFESDFCCISCDQKYEDHETLWETEAERRAARKATGQAYYPLADHPDIQKETLLKLGIDSRTPEQRFLDEMKEESKEQVITLNLNQSGVGPDVNIMVDTSKCLQPKQDLSKPEKSIQMMQKKGIAGQKPPTSLNKKE